MNCHGCRKEFEDEELIYWIRVRIRIKDRVLDDGPFCKNCVHEKIRVIEIKNENSKLEDKRKMKIITCDACERVLKDKEFRLIARVRFTNDENHERTNCIVHEGMEFCSSKCLKEFVDTKLRRVKNER